MNPVTITLLFLLFAAVMFALEKIPLALTSMIVCVGLVITGVLDAQTAFSSFVNSNVLLFVAMFIVSGALFETGMAGTIGGLVSKFAKTERELTVVIMLITGLMSAVLSNTGTAAILIPVVVGIAGRSGFCSSRLLMPLAFASTMGGSLSLVGTPVNMIGQSALEEVGLSFGFFEFAILGLPILVCGIIFYAFLGHKLLPNRHENESFTVSETKDYSHIPQWKKNLSLLILIGTLLAMVFEDIVGLPLYISGATGAILLVLTNVISEKQAYDSIDLQTIFLFGGTLSLATAMEQTGAGALIADHVLSLLGDNPAPVVVIFVLFVISCVLTNFMSNTATAALLAPIGLHIATGMSADPRAVVMAIVIGSACAYATPIGTPANTMVLQAGRYRFMDYVKAGLPLICIALIISMVLLPIFFPFFP